MRIWGWKPPHIRHSTSPKARLIPTNQSTWQHRFLAGNHYFEKWRETMSKFLEDCQFLLKTCGYSAYDSAEAFRYRWSGVINQVLSFWHIYFILTCFAFVCDNRQPRDERIYLTMSVVAFSEQAGAHYTFTAQKSNVFAFFEHFGALANQSERLSFVQDAFLPSIRTISIN